MAVLTPHAPPRTHDDGARSHCSIHRYQRINQHGVVQRQTERSDGNVQIGSARWMSVLIHTSTLILLTKINIRRGCVDHKGSCHFLVRSSKVILVRHRMRGNRRLHVAAHQIAPCSGAAGKSHTRKHGSVLLHKKLQGAMPCITRRARPLRTHCLEQMCNYVVASPQPLSPYPRYMACFEMLKSNPRSVGR